MTISPSLRPAEIPDHDAVFRLFAEVHSLHQTQHPEIFREPKNDEYFENFFTNLVDSESTHLLLLEQSNEAVGLVCYSYNEQEENFFTHTLKTVFIHHLVVANTHRRNGYATLLLNKVKEDAKKLAANQICLEHWHFNNIAEACFEKAGFLVGRIYMRMEL